MNFGSPERRKYEADRCAACEQEAEDNRAREAGENKARTRGAAPACARRLKGIKCKRGLFGCRCNRGKACSCKRCHNPKASPRGARDARDRGGPGGSASAAGGNPPPPPQARPHVAGANHYNTRRINSGMAGRTAMEVGTGRSGAGERPPYLQSLGGLEQCARAIEGMLGGDSGSQISILLLASDGDIVKAIQRAGPGVEIEKKGGAPPNKTVSLKVTGSSKDRSGRLLIVQAGIPNIYLAITHGGPHFVVTLPSVLEKMHPYAFVPRFSSGDIGDMLGILESRTGLTLTTRRITAYKRIGKKATYMRKAKKLKAGRGTRESTIIHAGVPFRESIESALENDQWIDKAQFVLSEGGDVRLEGHFSRGGLFKLRHSFLIFKEHVLPHVLDLSTKMLDLYSNRSMEDNGGDVSPLVIKLEAGTFRDRKQNHRFIEAMQGMKYTSTGVYHANPYVNMSLVDHMDGSAFEIWVMTPDEITIVPQLRATQASLSRLVGHIFEKFQEGDVLDYEE